MPRGFEGAEDALPGQLRVSHMVKSTERGSQMASSSPCLCFFWHRPTFPIYYIELRSEDCKSRGLPKDKLACLLDQKLLILQTQGGVDEP